MGRDSRTLKSGKTNGEILGDAINLVNTIAKRTSNNKTRLVIWGDMVCYFSYCWHYENVWCSCNLLVAVVVVLVVVCGDGGGCDGGCAGGGCDGGGGRVGLGRVGVSKKYGPYSEEGAIMRAANAGVLR